jgi:hypothetical protein
MNDSNRRRILAGTCAALLCLTLSTSVLDGLLSGDAPPSRGEIATAGFLAVLHAGLTIGAVFGITQLLRRRADRLGLAGAALTLLGAVVGARIGVLIQLSSLETTLPASRQTMQALLESAPQVWVSIIPIGLMYPLGLMTLGVALLIARPVSRWAGAALLIGGFFFPLGRAVGIVPAVYASDAIMAVAYGLLAWALLTKRELWDASFPVPSPQV